MKIILDEFYEDLTPEYLEERRSQTSELETLVIQKDYQSLESAIHKIAGSAGSYGLNELSNIAIKIEEAIIAKDYMIIEKHFKDFKEYIDSVEISFR